MEPVAEIEELIDDLEEIVNSAKAPAFSGGGNSRRVIDAGDFYAILDELRDRFPREFNDARRVLKEEAEIMDRAQRQADAIIADAQQQAAILASDQEVVRIAQMQAADIKDQAEQYERETRYNAEEYADSVLAHLEDNLKSVASSVARIHQTLAENSGARNQISNGNW